MTQIPQITGELQGVECLSHVMIDILASEFDVGKKARMEWSTFSYQGIRQQYWLQVNRNFTESGRSFGLIGIM